MERRLPSHALAAGVMNLLGRGQVDKAFALARSEDPVVVRGALSAAEELTGLLTNVNAEKLEEAYQALHGED